MRAGLENKDFSLLCPNCLGGILMHDLGLQFRTPTVNLMMTQTDFLQFVLHLREYLGGQFRFRPDQDGECPCADLVCGRLAPVTVWFTHYKTPEEAEKKWRERATRINLDNLFIFIEERDGITAEDLRKLASLSVRVVAAFTCHEYPDIPYAVYLPKYLDSGEVGNILRRRRFDDSREYERYFDFVRWFNEADGKNYDVSRFVK